MGPELSQLLKYQESKACYVVDTGLAPSMQVSLFLDLSTSCCKSYSKNEKSSLAFLGLSIRTCLEVKKPI